VGQRSLGIGVDRNVSLDEESAAGSGGIADGLEPASEREYTDLDRIAPKNESSRVLRFFESLGYVPPDGLQREQESKSLGWKICGKIDNLQTLVRPA
jgi:hypothetical protein